MDSTPSEPSLPPAAASPAQERPPVKEPITLASGLLLALGLLGALGVSFIKAVGQYGGFPHTENGWAYLTGITLAPLLLSCIVVGIYYTIRKERRTRLRVASYVVLWTAIIAFVSRQPATPPHFPDNEREMGQLTVRAFREASGAIPPEQYSRDELVVTMRAVFREAVLFRQQYEQEATQFNTAEMENLYTPASFQNKKVIEETVRQLKNMAVVEEKYSSLDSVIDHAASQVKQKDWSERTKSAFLEGMEGSLRKGQQGRLEVFRKEREWISASIELYTFVRDNYPAFSIRRNQIVVNDDKTLETFNQKLTRATQLRKEVVKAAEAFEQSQKAQIGKYGLTPSDFGTPSR